MVVEWKKQEGDPVSKDEIVVVIESEKASQDVEALTDGVLHKILAQVGEVVPIEKPLAIIRLATDTAEDLRQYDSSASGSAVVAERETVAASTPEPVKADRRARISPLARKLAEERGVDLSSLPPGSGPNGRITEQDVLAYCEGRGQAASTPAMEAGDRRIPLSEVRRRTIASLRQSRDETIPVTSVTEIDLTDLLELHHQLKPAWEKTHKIKVTLNAFFIKAAALALRRHEILNSVLADGEIVVKGAVNVGLAMHVNDGLYVPVIRNADQLTVLEIAQTIAQFLRKIQSKTITAADMAGGTFTITNVGPFDVLFSTPVIVYPQAGILGIGTISARPVFVGETIAKRQLCHLCLTYDHRIVDGAPAALFRQTMRKLLEEPAALLK
jgi:pyruvate dehydrogenase E2 component (dihydrolipoamide acetyltransferase)